MIQTIDDLAQCATELPPEQRFTLARRILESVEPEGNAGIDSAWEMEIRERIRRYDSGEIKGIPASEVFAELDKRLAR
jgi:putative addiction module component (TIGR02574 family)